MRNTLKMVNDHTFTDIITMLEFMPRPEGKRVSIDEWRAHFSSPRLFDIKVRDGAFIKHLPKVNVSFLEQHSMLADDRHQTLGMSLAMYEATKSILGIVDKPIKGESYTNIEVWPFDPNKVSDRQRFVGVVLGFTAVELYCPRLCQAIEEVASAMGLELQPLECN